MTSGALVIALPGYTVRVRTVVPLLTAAITAIYRVRRDRIRVDAEYELTMDGGEIVTSRGGHEICRGRYPDGIFELYIHLYDATAQSPDHHLLHAGATGFGDRAIVVLGESESGKSTLTALLAARGGAVLSDDIVPINYRSGRCAPYPRRMFLRPESVRRTPAVLAAVTLLREWEISGQRLLTAEPNVIPAPRARFWPAAFLFPRWSNIDQPFVVRPLSPGVAAARLMDNSVNLRHAGHPVIQSCARLASSIPAYELDVRDPAAAAEWAVSLLPRDARAIA